MLLLLLLLLLLLPAAWQQQQEDTLANITGTCGSFIAAAQHYVLPLSKRVRIHC
jgi:hypothetical protein